VGKPADDRDVVNWSLIRKKGAAYAGVLLLTLLLGPKGLVLWHQIRMAFNWLLSTPLARWRTLRSEGYGPLQHTD